MKSKTPEIIYHIQLGMPWEFGGLKKPSLPRALDLMQEAGFNATIVWAWPELIEEMKKRGMTRIGFMDGSLSGWEKKLEEIAPLDVERINVQFLDHDTPASLAARTWIKMEKRAAQLGLTIDLETHRDTCTETPEKILEINQFYRKATGKDISLSWDFSHFAVSKHLSAPYAERLLAKPFDRLLQKSRMIHARAFNGQHCQVPVINRKGELTPEVKDYLEFVDAMLACWFAKAKAGDTLYLMPEQLTRAGGYGLSIFENVWTEIKVLRVEIHKIWLKNLALWKSKSRR